MNFYKGKNKKIQLINRKNLQPLAIKLKEVKQEDDKEVIKVYQMQNLGNLFLSYIKPNYKQCERCGKLVKIKSKNDGRTKYCAVCRKKVDSQLVMESRNKEKQLREVQA